MLEHNLNLTFFATLFALYFGASVQVKAQDQPTLPELLRVEPPALDLGQLKKGSKAQAVFYFTNITDKTLFVGIKSSCGCIIQEYLTSKDPSGNIKPGETKKVNLRIGTNQVMLKNTTIVMTVNREHTIKVPVNFEVVD